MYSVRESMAADPIETTRSVIEMGYRHLEFANLTDGDHGVGFTVDPGELRELITAAGAQPVSTHVGRWDEDSLADVIAFHRDLGTKYLVSRMLSRNIDDLRELGRTINRVGDRLQDAGIEHLLHTSLMRSTDTRTDLDELLDVITPEFRGLELDTYWAHRSGLDIVGMIERYGENIRILHQKDLPAEISQPVNIIGALPDDTPLLPEYLVNDKYIAPDNFTEVGTGILPLQATIDAAIRYSDADYIFVEQDYTSMPELDSVRTSLEHLKQAEGVTL
jgi:sugar phosphate isomerase/epimerase